MENKEFVLDINRIYPNNREFKGNSLLELIDTYVIVDIETTGFSPQYDKIIEIGAVKIINNEITEEFQEFINIETELDPFISNLTGITKDMLLTAKDIVTVLQEFEDFLGDNIIIAHNANFDVNFLYDNYIKYLNKPLENNFLDTMRLSKKLVKNITNYKLSTLAEFFDIEFEGSHRALKDSQITYKLYNKLKQYANNYYDMRMKEIEISLVPNEEFRSSKVVVKGTMKFLDFKIIKEVLKKVNCRTYDIFFSFCNYLIMNDITYEKYKNIGTSNEYFGMWLYKANNLEKEGKLKVISESEFCKKFSIPIIKQENRKRDNKISAKEIVCTVEEFEESHILYGKTCVFTGTLEKMLRKEAMQQVVDIGGVCGDSVTKQTNYLILGNNDYCRTIKDGKSSKQKRAEELKLKGYDIEIISENDFYDMIEVD